MFISLRNLVVNIMAAFIRDKEERHKFRNKHKIRSKFRKLRDDNRILFYENKILRNEINKIKTDIIKINEKNFFRYKQSTILAYRKFLDLPDLQEKYKNLIDGLDDESIECVSRILSRVKLISQQDLGTDPKAFGTIDIYSVTEIEKLNKLRKEFLQKIIQISDDCFAYKQYLLPINRFESSVFYYEHQLSSLNNINKLRNKDFIDVGGFIGDSALVFSKYTKGKIYSFEAVSKNYDNMLKTIKLNNLKNVIPVKYALGSKEEVLKISTGNYGEGMGCHIDIDQNNIQGKFEETQIITLDSFCSNKDLDIGLIKVDIEGFEQEFLKGAVNTINSHLPTMLISIYHNNSDFFNIKQIVESWDLGYQFKIRQPTYGNLKDETLLICENDS